MDYTFVDEVAAMIPSKAVQQYVLDTGWKFTDAEKATMLYACSPLPLAEKHLWLRRLAKTTTDETLQKQIITLVDSEEKLIRQAGENDGHRYLYSLKASQDGMWNGEYYVTWEAALAEGKSRCIEYQTGFSIEKCLPVDVKEAEDEAHPKFYYNNRGELDSVSGATVSGLEAWFEMPNPFKKGDIIKTSWGLYGIVETTQENWKLRADRCRNSLRLDTFDNLIRIQGLIGTHGCFINYYDCITPFDLEYYKPNENWREDRGSIDKLLMYASLVMRGQGSYDNLYTATMEYQEKMTEHERLKRDILRILGTGRWMNRDEIIEHAKTDDRKAYDSDFYGLIFELIEDGYVQSVTSFDKGEPAYIHDGSELLCTVYDVYYCGMKIMG